MKMIKKEQEEPKYFVQEIAQAVGLSEGTVKGYYANEDRKKSVKDGLTLKEIVAVLERDKTRTDGIDWNAVKEIRRRLSQEYGYIIDRSDEEEN